MHETTPEHSQEQREILELLASELQEQLELSLDPSAVETGGARERLERTATEVENLEHAAQLIGLTGLAGTCVHLCYNFNELKSQAEKAENAEVKLLLDSWPVYLLDYVQQLQEGRPSPDSVDALLNFLGEQSWAWPLPKVEQALLRSQLQQPSLSLPETEYEAPEVPLKADLELMSLALSEDVNPSLYEGLMLELPTQVEQFSDSLARYSAHQSQDALDRAKRIAHTVKGSANVVGVAGLANFMHYSEDLLERLTGEAAPSEAVADLLTEMADTAAALLDHLLDGTQPGESELDVLQKMLNHYHQTDDDEGTESRLSVARYEPLSVEEPAADYLATKDQNEAATQPDEALPAQGTPDTYRSQLRIEEPKIHALLTLAGEASIGNHRLLTQTHRTQQTVQQLQLQQQKLFQLTDELGQLIEIRNLFAQQQGHGATDQLDPLELDRYNELHSFYHQLQEFSADSRDLLNEAKGELRELEELTQSQHNNHQDNQTQLLDLLTLPAQTLSSRLQRCVRQACRLTGKQAQLTIMGGECRLDSQTLQKLTDPLMHLLRNAIDHGIETSEERRTHGKSPEGQLRLEFQPRGQATVVSLSDDGMGLDWDRIHARALELQIPEADSEAYEQWLQSLIFLPGFSTRAQVSQTSGRGVGLDAVAEQIQQLKGRIQVTSQPGEGTQFSLEIPNTLIAEHQLLVNLGGQALALSSRGIEQVLFMDPEQLSNRKEQLFYRYQEQTIPVRHLAQLAPLPIPAATDTRQAQALLTLEISPGKTQGILVDQILASREMVVKPLPRYAPQVPGVLGATILGDGRVAPVLDCLQLVSQAETSDASGPDWLTHNVELEKELNQRQRPLALVIDDSLSSRRSLAQFVGDMGMDVITARDGFEAIEKLEEQHPSLVLVDMEMPRMNGLEFTAHLRAQETLRGVPVIMITSRNTTKHRKMASAAGVDRYLNKPFSEDELLRSIQESLH